MEAVRKLRNSEFFPPIISSDYTEYFLEILDNFPDIDIKLSKRITQTQNLIDKISYGLILANTGGEENINYLWKVMLG